VSRALYRRTELTLDEIVPEAVPTRPRRIGFDQLGEGAERSTDRVNVDANER
jgi:hypothetical protein